MSTIEPPLPDWARAFGSPLFPGLIRRSPEDFRVDEEAGFACSGDGEHDYLRIEKRGANTGWVARALAQHAGIPARDVGYAGQKDRHAVTTQWFSVRRPGRQGTNWRRFSAEGVRILEIARHDRKLRHGSHRGNRFEILVRGRLPSAPDLERRLAALRARGVPNYFGPQRFGRGGGNIGLATRLFAGERLRRASRSIALSAARSLLFNEILSRRVEADNWDEVLPGEAVNLAGSASYFVANEVTDDIVARVSAFDLHPTGAMWGRGSPACAGAPAEIEASVAGRFPAIVDGLERAGLDAGQRALRLPLPDLEWDMRPDALLLRFALGPGAFATAVVREIAVLPDD